MAVTNRERVGKGLDHLASLTPVEQGTRDEIASRRELAIHFA